MTDTQSDETAEPETSEPRTVGMLVRVLSAHAPGEPPMRHALVDVDRVELGRGAAFGHARRDRVLRLDIVDRWASELHCRLARSIGRWQLEDLGSKNGTRINAKRVTSTFLADGDVVEIGRTSFLFVHAVLAGDAPDRSAFEALPGVTTIDPDLGRLLGQLAIIARGTTPILLHGPTGTGKEVIARGAHAASGRGGPFVPVNCGAIPRELVESTLFGHRRGAFSGALDDEPGLVRTAHLGTLFLDEIGDLPLPAQATLLRVLQEHEVTPVGGTRPIAVDLRVISATHRDLEAMAERELFRTDLLHRLKGFACALPALEHRRVDFGALVGQLIARLAPGRAQRLTLHPLVVRTLLAHSWPGNIRELERVLGAAIELAREDCIELEHLPAELTAAAPTATDEPDEERERVVGLLREHRGNIRAIARSIGKDPVQVRRWLRRYGLDADEFR